MFSMLLLCMEDFPMEKHDLLRHDCFLNYVEIGGSITRVSKRLLLAVSWPRFRRCGATKISKILLH